jgi:putative hemolysin
MTLLVLIFSEITPKSLAANKADSIAAAVVRPIYAFMKLLRPVIFILTGITRFILRLFGINQNRISAHVTEEELKTMMDVAMKKASWRRREKITEKVFEFGDEQVRYVMIPRTEVFAVDREDDYQSILETFRSTRFSRLPVYDETLDSIIGLLHMKDFFLFSGDPDSFNMMS